MSLVSFYVIGYSVFLSDYKDITFLPTLKINNDFFINCKPPHNLTAQNNRLNNLNQIILKRFIGKAV